MKKYSLVVRADAGAAGDMFLGALYSLCVSIQEKDIAGIDVGKLKEKILALGSSLGEGFKVQFANEMRLDQESLRIVLVSESDLKKSHHVTPKKINSMLEKYMADGLLNEAEVLSARQIIDIISVAESIAHGVTVDKVHFHEIGEEDSIFDIIASGILVSTLREALGEFKVYYSPVEVGHGKVDTSHGLLDIPAPATRNIILDSGMKTKCEFSGECLPPTGAAVLASLKPSLISLLSPDDIDIITKGSGCGSSNPNDRSNILTIELIN